MLLELKDIKDSGLEKEYSFSAATFPVVAELQEREGINFSGPLMFRLRLQRAGQIVEVDGHLATSVRLNCGRCLEEYEQPIESDFVLTFTPQEEQRESEEEELELDADELGLVYYRDETLDLTHPLEEQVVMALPISPVCKERCRGLCSECGCNLNEKTCSCEKKPFNNKFSALSGLKLDKSD